MNLQSLIVTLGGVQAWELVVAMFWYPLFFEVPRFLLANLAAGIALVGTRSGGRNPATIEPGRRPRSVSVILPAHNGGAGIVNTALSLREQTWRDIQIVVVDDGSTDQTGATCQQLLKRELVDIVMSSDLRGGKSASLNLGLRYCTGAVVISADADTTFDRDSIEEICRPFDDPRVGCVGGNIGVRNPKASTLAALQAVEYAITISLGRRVSAMLGLFPVAAGAFSAFRAEALASVGGWEAGPGEDVDLACKLRRAGWRVAFADKAWALTDVPTGLAGLVAQRLRWESDLIRLSLRKFRIQAPWRQAFSVRDTLSTLDTLLFSVGPACVFLVYLVWLVASYGFLALPILAIGGMVYSIVAVATYALATSLSQGRPSLRLMPYAVGYGVYCVCLLHFVRIWAFVDEMVFARSYRSQFVPKKVLARIRRS